MRQRRVGAFIVALAGAALAAPARAAVSGGLKQTVGSQGYAGTKLYVDLGGDLHIRPSYSQYRSDTSSGTYKTISARLGYDKEHWGVGMTAGGSPKQNGYSNRIVGFDAMLALSPSLTKSRGGLGRRDNDTEGRGLRVELGGGVQHTAHREEVGVAGARRAGGAVEIGQTDLELMAAAEAFLVRLDASFVKSTYNKDLGELDARSGQITALAGLNSLISGFPAQSSSLRLETTWLPRVTPFVSYTRTAFKIAQPASDSVAVGASLRLKIVGLTASYERYDPGGGESIRNYYSFGASLRL